MEPEASLLCSQELATVPYPEPDESSPRYALFLWIHLKVASNLCIVPSADVPSTVSVIISVSG
jgi:hypothetical protein